MADATAKAVFSIIDMGSEDRRPQLRELIKHLFPNVEWALGGPHYADEFGQEWYRDLRVCSAKMFDRYFRLTVSDEELSQASIQRLLRARGSRENLRIELENLHSRGLLSLAIEELAGYQDEIEPNQTEPFTTAIFDVADLLSDEKRGTFEIPVHWRIGFLNQKSLEKLSEQNTRLEVLTNALTKTNGLFMATDFVALVGATREGKTQGIFSDAELVAVRAAAVRKIKSAADSGELAQHPKLAVVLSLWQMWGKKEDVTNYVNTMTETAEGESQLLRSLVVRSLRQAIGDYVGTERFYMRRIDIETLIPTDVLDARVQAFPVETLNAEDRRAVSAFNKAMERRRAGKSDDDPFAID